MQKLISFYSEESPNIPKKIDQYYKFVLEDQLSSVSSIIVKVSHLGTRGVEYLCRILPFYAHIEELRLWKVGLDPPATDRLSYYLPFLAKLKRLSLEDNSLNDESVQNLCRAFKSLRELRELWLACNNITAVGAVCLCSNLTQLPKLEILNVDFNSVEDEGCNALCVTLCKAPRLQMLGLEANSISSLSVDELLNLAHRNSPVKFTNLKGNKLTAGDCQRLETEFGSGKVDLSLQM